MANLLQRVKRLESARTNRDIVELTRYDILVNGQSILPSPLRTYQKKLFDIFVHGDNDKSYLMWSRRSGKSFTAFVILLYICLRDKNTNAFQLFPDHQMANKIIWKGVFIVNGKSVKFIDILPKSLYSLNHSSMTITLYNGSSIRLMGTSDPDKLRGITSNLIAMSEYSFFKDYVLPVITPIISSSKGKMLIETTPNGQNFAYRQFNNFSKDNKWFTHKGTVETLLDEQGNRYITDEVIKDAVSNGMSEGLISLDQTLITYARELKEMKILDNVYNPRLQIHFAFDLGINDSTAVVGFQIRDDGGINIVFAYENNNQPYEHYINYCFRHYGNRRIGKFILPHDGAKRSGQSSSLETVSQHFESFGCDVERLKRPKSMTGFISLVKSHIASVIIEQSCDGLIDALNNYSYDEKTRRPIHDSNSHYASAFGYAIMSVYYGLSNDLHNNEVIRYAL
jgi:hypothetical protein